MTPGILIPRSLGSLVLLIGSMYRNEVHELSLCEAAFAYLIIVDSMKMHWDTNDIL